MFKFWSKPKNSNKQIRSIKKFNLLLFCFCSKQNACKINSDAHHSHCGTVIYPDTTVRHAYNPCRVLMTRDCVSIVNYVQASFFCQNLTISEFLYFNFPSGITAPPLIESQVHTKVPFLVSGFDVSVFVKLFLWCALLSSKDAFL